MLTEVKEQMRILNLTFEKKANLKDLAKANSQIGKTLPLSQWNFLEEIKTKKAQIFKEIENLKKFFNEKFLAFKETQTQFQTN